MHRNDLTTNVQIHQYQIEQIRKENTKLKEEVQFIRQEIQRQVISNAHVNWQMKMIIVTSSAMLSFLLQMLVNAWPISVVKPIEGHHDTPALSFRVSERTKVLYFDEDAPF